MGELVKNRQFPHVAPLYLIVCFSLLMCALIGYLALSIGIVDATIIAPHRQKALTGVEMASSSDPPDVGYLAEALQGPDWAVSAAAAERIQALHKSRKLTETQVDSAIQALFKTLSAGGHWWRFNWDTDEPDYERFRAVAIEAIAAFGSKALPQILAATESNSSYEREAACWVVSSMAKQELVDTNALAQYDLAKHISNLVQHDPNRSVRRACSAAQAALNSQN